MKILIIHFLGALFFLTFSPASDWPKFRGPTGDGHANVKSIPLKWNATENVKWKVPVPGKGWSSPVLSGGKIYLTTAFAEGDNQDAAGVKRELEPFALMLRLAKQFGTLKFLIREPLPKPFIRRIPMRVRLRSLRMVKCMCILGTWELRASILKGR